LRSYKDYLIPQRSSIREALSLLDGMSSIDPILFVVDEQDRLVGSLTDGDIRRGLISRVDLDDKIENIFQNDPKYIVKGQEDFEKILIYRESNLRVIPVVDLNHCVVNVVNFREIKSYLPIDAVIMAGGKGQRLLPLTEHTPKPLLVVGNKPIIEHNLDRLAMFGIDDFWISINYLGEMIESYFGDGSLKNVRINYIKENRPLGTLGAVSLVDKFKHDYILITNSDLLTNIDYEHFFLDFISQDADMAVVTIPYQVNIPYAVLETEDGNVLGFKEKPTYTYYSNGGIYLLKKSLIEMIPKDDFYNATDLMNELIKQKKKVYSYPLMGYWLDIGTPSDLDKAHNDVTKIKFT
jgi:dTDP-glucose pyrophosphorylase